jgi:hypothetical protein
MKQKISFAELGLNKFELTPEQKIEAKIFMARGIVYADKLNLELGEELAQPTPEKLDEEKE